MNKKELEENVRKSINESRVVFDALDEAPNKMEKATIMAPLSDNEKAQYILQNTSDGNMLAPKHLKLVEMGINGLLNGNGKKAFDELYDLVSAGYVEPWFHGIEHMTKDHNGYVYWRGHDIEHYSYHSFEEEKRNALKLGERCRELERWGYPVTLNNCMALHDGEKPKRTVRLFTINWKKPYNKLRFWNRYTKKYQIRQIKNALKIRAERNVGDKKLEGRKPCGLLLSGRDSSKRRPHKGRTGFASLKVPPPRVSKG